MENSKSNRKKENLRKITASAILISILLAFGLSVYYNITLQDQLTERDYTINTLTLKNSILDKVFTVKYDSTSGVYHYTTTIRGDSILRYDEISNELSEVRSQYYNLLMQEIAIEDSLDSFKIILKLIMGNYPITYSITTSKNSKLYSVESKTLDSAMILFPYFRDRLKFDQEEKAWMITPCK